MDHIVPFGVRAQTYVYEHPVEAHAIVVMKRSLGFMAALPLGILSDEELLEGTTAPMEALIGPSFVIEVAASLLADEGLLPQPGVTFSCVLVDFAADAAPRFSVLGEEPGDSVVFQLKFARASARALGPVAAGLGLGPAHRHTSGASCVLLRGPAAPPKALPRRCAKASRWGYRFRSTGPPATKGHCYQEGHDNCPGLPAGDPIPLLCPA